MVLLETDHPKLRREIGTEQKKAVTFTVILMVFREKADCSFPRLYSLRNTETLSCVKTDFRKKKKASQTQSMDTSKQRIQGRGIFVYPE